MARGIRLFPGIKGRLAAVFSEQAESEPAPRVPPPAAAGTTLHRLDATDLPQLAAQAIAGREDAAVGRLHMVGLAEIKARIGERWPAVEDKVHEMFRRCAARVIGPRDVMFERDPGQFVILFRDLSKEAAQLACANILVELHRRFLGDPDLSQIRVSSAVGTTDGAMLFDDASLSEVLDRIAANTVAADEDDLSDGDGPATDQEPPAPPIAPKASSPIWQYAYQPLWNLQQQVVASYQCYALRERRGGLVDYGYSVLDDQGDADAVAEFDGQVLDHAINMISQLIATRSRVILVVPANFETLARPSTRARYLERLRAVSPACAQCLRLELTGFPPGVTQARLFEAVGPLRPHFRGLYLHADLQQTDFMNFADTGLALVGATVPRHSLPEATIIALMNRFCAAAQKARLKTYLLDVTSSSIALNAAAAGFTYIAGDRVAAVRELPRRMVRFDWMDFYRIPRSGGQPR